METPYTYFNRDISWLSFNYRVLLEAADSSLPIYERIKFLSIHASNLEEFYQVRAVEYREGREKHDEEILHRINQESICQQEVSSKIYNEGLLPELRRQGIVLYNDTKIQEEHRGFVQNYFEEEVFPFLQPVWVKKDELRMFLRHNRLYLVIRLLKGEKCEYVIMKIPFSKVPRFVALPKMKDTYYYMYIEDCIAANLSFLFPGYQVDTWHSIKISRDADLFFEEEVEGDYVEDLMQKVRRRKIGRLSRFVYDREMPADMLQYLCETFALQPEDLMPGGKHLNIEALSKLPNPRGKKLEQKPAKPMRVRSLDKAESMLSEIGRRDVLLHYPYQSFTYFLRFLQEAAHDPEVKSIKLTQYRVADKSEVIEALLTAAELGKKVTVFVEIKARFDEENNWYTSELMRRAGISIVFSLPKLKVHAKIALVSKEKGGGPSLGYISTGNFNEDTAGLYADLGLFTARKAITDELREVFRFLEQKKNKPSFSHLLVAQFNLLPELHQKIEREIEAAGRGEKARIVLKMNGIQDEGMIDALYRASEAGVEIDLLVRGICCLRPNQWYSKHIRITRIVDMFLEHARVWYFYRGGEEEVYLASADWLRRNLYRRIEVAAPIYDKQLKRKVIDSLELQLRDNRKAVTVDENLQNIPKKKTKGERWVRTQTDMFDLWKE